MEMQVIKSKKELDATLNVVTGKTMESVRMHIIRAYLNACGLNTFVPDIDSVGFDFGFVMNGQTYRVQLKSRMTVDGKYLHKNLYIMFPLKSNAGMLKHNYVIVPHDKLYTLAFDKWNFHNKGHNGYSKASLTDDQVNDVLAISVCKPMAPLAELEELKYI